MFEIIYKKWRYFICEIKTANRWQYVSVNKWVIAIEPNHLNSWFIQERITVICSETQTVLWLCWNYFVEK